MTTIKYTDFCRDIAGILRYANDKNMPVITEAIGTVSKYAHQLSECDSEPDTDENVQAIVKAINHFESTDEPTAEDKAAKPTNEPAGTDSDAEPEELVEAEKAYRFNRKLIGAVVNGNHYSESIIRKTDLQDGDMVRVKYGSSYRPEFELVSRGDPEQAEPIVRKRVIAEEDPTIGLVARKEYNGELLTHDDAPVTIRLNYKDSIKNSVQDGDIVDIAYYADRGPAEARVSWVYRDSDLDTQTAETRKPHSAYVESTDKSPKIITPKLDFDLSNKTVLMAGYSAHRAEVDDVIKAHHGKLLVYDGEASGKGIESDLITAVKHADIVIVMLHSVSHETANKAIANAKSFDKMVATSNINSPLSLEEAIQRALNREPIYQQTSHIVE